MGLFSQRHGYTPASDVLQLEDMDGPLRVAIWNAVHEVFCRAAGSFQYSPLHEISAGLWAVFLRRPLDQVPGSVGQWADVLKTFILRDAEWFEVYDLVEFLAQQSGKADLFTGLVNVFLSNERSGYRLVAREITPLTSETEIEAVDAAATTGIEPARKHLRKALQLFSDREAPDYANSVKESISAVESACQDILGVKITAGDGVKRLRETLGLHPALAEGFSKLYGFTSAAGNIRHANHGDDTVVTEDEARYFLVTCSAFVNYLTAKSISEPQRIQSEP